MKRKIDVPKLKLIGLMSIVTGQVSDKIRWIRELQEELENPQIKNSKKIQIRRQILNLNNEIW